MQSAGKRITGISITVFSFLSATVVVVFTLLGRGPGGIGDSRFAQFIPLVISFIPVALFVSFAGGLLWLAGWIVEGFAVGLED